MAHDALTLGPTGGAPVHCCGVVELRRYLLHPNARETLVELFERDLIEPQEEVGMRVIGQFRDSARPDVFTWFRGFADMRSRRDALERFYGGPVWARHRDAANRTMIDSDDVRLLRPAWPGAAFSLPHVPRPPRGAPERSGPLVGIFIHTLVPSAVGEFAELFRQRAAPELTACGGAPVAAFETEPSANDFPRLPVREGEHCFVWVATFADEGHHAEHVARLDASQRWQRDIVPALGRCMSRPLERWLLTPTPRSLVPHAG